MLFGKSIKIKKLEIKSDFYTLILGDIHGCIEELLEIYNNFLSQVPSGSKRRIISLGDLVDRGPDSKAVIDWFLSAPRGEERLAVRGNHEIMFDEFIRSPSLQSSWLKVGGIQTLESYSKNLTIGEVNRNTIAQAIEQIPKQHVNFCRALPDLIILGNVCLVHAAIDPSKHLNSQSIDRLHWGPCIGPDEMHLVRFRDANIKQVIHGHEPHSELPKTSLPVINLDTGCYKTGVLSGLIFDQYNKTPLQTAHKKKRD